MSDTKATRKRRLTDIQRGLLFRMSYVQRFRNEDLILDFPREGVAFTIGEHTALRGLVLRGLVLREVVRLGTERPELTDADRPLVTLYYLSPAGREMLRGILTCQR